MDFKFRTLIFENKRAMGVIEKQYLDADNRYIDLIIPESEDKERFREREDILLNLLIRDASCFWREQNPDKNKTKKFFSL
jgi:hypothetical protein